VAALAPDGVGRGGADPEDFDAARDVGGALVQVAKGELALGDELGDEREVGWVGARDVAQRGGGGFLFWFSFWFSFSF
jgi:hypothetical protein